MVAPGLFGVSLWTSLKLSSSSALHCLGFLGEPEKGVLGAHLSCHFFPIGIPSHSASLHSASAGASPDLTRKASSAPVLFTGPVAGQDTAVWSLSDHVGSAARFDP